MQRYLLDTHILVWALSKNEYLNKNIREGIEYFQNSYFVSMEVLHELVTLIQYGDIRLKLSIIDIIAYLAYYNISIFPTTLNHLKVLEKLPVLNINGKEHKDPTDRLLIAQAMAEKMILISADQKFPDYATQKGFHLLEN